MRPLRGEPPPTGNQAFPGSTKQGAYHWAVRCRMQVWTLLVHTCTTGKAGWADINSTCKKERREKKGRRKAAVLRFLFRTLAVFLSPTSRVLYLYAFLLPFLLLIRCSRKFTLMPGPAVGDYLRPETWHLALGRGGYPRQPLETGPGRRRDGDQDRDLSGRVYLDRFIDNYVVRSSSIRAMLI